MFFFLWKPHKHSFSVFSFSHKRLIMLSILWSASWHCRSQRISLSAKGCLWELILCEMHSLSNEISIRLWFWHHQTHKWCNSIIQNTNANFDKIPFEFFKYQLLLSRIQQCAEYEQWWSYFISELNDWFRLITIEFQWNYL